MYVYTGETLNIYIKQKKIYFIKQKDNLYIYIGCYPKKKILNHKN